jgi:hypothetical protein
MDKLDLEHFDYTASAQLFALKGRKYGPVTFHRFDTAAEGLRFAIETLPAERLKGSFMETASVRLDAAMMRQLYGAPRYPLKG